MTKPQLIDSSKPPKIGTRVLFNVAYGKAVSGKIVAYEMLDMNTSMELVAIVQMDKPFSAKHEIEDDHTSYTVHSFLVLGLHVLYLEQPHA